ncbi:hypothetical protein ACWGNN_25345 [Streptomyces sp. NPDC055817]
MNTEASRLCWRCQEPIARGQLSEQRDVFSASGAGATIDLHKRCPKAPPPTQRYPVGREQSS